MKPATAAALLRFLLLMPAVLPWGCAGATPEETAPPQGFLEYLWPNGAPGAVGEELADKPSISVHRVPRTGGPAPAVVICPGGGYTQLMLTYEGEAVVRWLNARGIAAFLLRYRHAPRYRHPHPLLDAQRAIRLIRSRAGEWNVDPARVGIMGFSAGGHLTGTAATCFDAGKPDAADPIERTSCRPDFAVLIYPVITFEKPHAHLKSRQALLGERWEDPGLIAELSLEKRVTRETPPCFLAHGAADRAVPVENSRSFYLAMREAGVPGELHVYEKETHGFRMNSKTGAFFGWRDDLEGWLRTQKILP